MNAALTYRPFENLNRSNARLVTSPTVNYAKGWRKARAITAEKLPGLEDVIIRERGNTLLLIRVLSVTVAVDKSFAGFVGVYCDRTGKPLPEIHAPRFYRTGKISAGGFYRARPNHKREVFKLA